MDDFPKEQQNDLTILSELTEELGQKVIKHRNRFIKLIRGKYLELLPSLIYVTNAEKTSIDFLKVEVALRNNYYPVIGELTNGNLSMIGYLTSTKNSIENPESVFNNGVVRRTGNDITYILPKELLKKPDEYIEISNVDDCKTGNFVVLNNKAVTFTSDVEVIEHFVRHMGEIEASRYSIAIQSKVSTFFTGKPNDETLNQIIAKVYNGSPFIKTSKNFDPEEQIHTIDNSSLGTLFSELKRELQNIHSELNTFIGIQSLGVDKNSGVSETEAKSNRGFTTSVSNTYLAGRNIGYKKLNKRYNLELEAIYNDDIVSELKKVMQPVGGMDNEDNNNTI